jgi:hypothetical protein
METGTGIDKVKNLRVEHLGELYFRSLGNATTKQNHIELASLSPRGTMPTAELIERDVRSWYSGVHSIATDIDPNVTIPDVDDVVEWITTNFEKSRGAIAA